MLKNPRKRRPNHEPALAATFQKRTEPCCLYLVIIVVALARYVLIGPFVERWEWVKSQLEIQPQLLEKNLRFLGQRDELVAMLEGTQSELKAREPKLLTGDTPSVSASDRKM